MFVLDTTCSGVVDFNSMDEDDRVIVPLRNVRGVPAAPGRTIALMDYEGHSCLAVVEAHVPSGLRVVPVWESWRDAPKEVFSNVSIVRQTSATGARFTYPPELAAAGLR